METRSTEIKICSQDRGEEDRRRSFQVLQTRGGREVYSGVIVKRHIVFHTYTHVISSARVLEEGMSWYVPAASLQVWPQRVHASELEQIRFLDFRPAKLLQLLQPAAQHRLDAFVYLRTRTSRVR